MPLIEIYCISISTFNQRFSVFRPSPRPVICAFWHASGSPCSAPSGTHPAALVLRFLARIRQPVFRTFWPASGSQCSDPPGTHPATRVLRFLARIRQPVFRTFCPASGSPRTAYVSRIWVGPPRSLHSAFKKLHGIWRISLCSAGMPRKLYLMSLSNRQGASGKYEHFTIYAMVYKNSRSYIGCS